MFGKFLKKEEEKKGSALPAHGSGPAKGALPSYSPPAAPRATAPTISVFPEPTPNPASMKFSIMGKTILPIGALDFPNVESATEAPLAQEMFAISGVCGVLLGTNFVTITKTGEVAWPDLIDTVIERLTAFLQSGKPLVHFPERISSSGSESASEVEQKVREILDREIRPAVARDGGDVTFYSYSDGVVTLNLRGSCSSCPSSVMTLKMGIETRLRALIPEITEVISL
ncbi:MAG: NifU family protein [Deltaproteobacteria bacterium]|nr:NifU family protein [Deltaproteobacteria bacterium]